MASYGGFLWAAEFAECLPKTQVNTEDRSISLVLNQQCPLHYDCSNYGSHHKDNSPILIGWLVGHLPSHYPAVHMAWTDSSNLPASVLYPLIFTSSTPELTTLRLREKEDLIIPLSWVISLVWWMIGFESKPRTCESLPSPPSVTTAFHFPPHSGYSVNVSQFNKLKSPMHCRDSRWRWLEKVSFPSFLCN